MGLLLNANALRMITVFEYKSFIVVAATHDTSYQNDAGGIKASSRWLSEATPPVMTWG